jgi:hypothetical protein
MSRYARPVAVLVAASLAACAGGAPPPAGLPPAPTPEARAQAAALDFSQRLRTALQGELAKDGPVQALAFCHDQAPVIAAAVMAKYGVRLGRVAVPGRERNPGNAAADWQRPALERFAQAVAAGAPAQAQVEVIASDLPEGVALRMLRGIAVEAPCQLCHGPAVAPAIAGAIRRLYPADAATGFAEGDLRGALWVEVPLATTPAGAVPRR